LIIKPLLSFNHFFVNKLKGNFNSICLIIESELLYGDFMKILVIDDDPAMTDLLKLILVSTDAEVFTANSGIEGLKKIKELSPSVVILDLMMPDMDGWQITAEIRTFSSVPVMILSVIDNPGLVARALDAGADDYLIKPAPRNVLIAHINNLTRRNTSVDTNTSTLHFIGAV
jgi:two-component system KDP operon response regulator KdpE